MTAIPPEVRVLLDAPNYVHLSVLLRDGAPMSMAVWCALEGEHILISSSQDSPKVAAVRRDPRVALSVTDRDQPYRSAMLRGRVVAMRPDPDLRAHNRGEDNGAVLRELLGYDAATIAALEQEGVILTKDH